MIESTLAKAAESMHGILQGPDVRFCGVSTDTRTIGSGELFIALRGPNFDGNEFVTAAALRKAAAAVITGELKTEIPVISVPDTRAALGALASAWRDKMPATFVGITGSNGKTTVKEMIASCLAGVAPTLATKGNLNNEIGLPLTLLRLDSKLRYAVIEMGANHAGEIAYLTSLARPDIVVITNAGPAHLEGFGSVQDVARAKGEILQGIPSPGIAVLNADDKYFDYWTSICTNTAICSFGLSPTADVSAYGIESDDAGSRFEIRFDGRSIDIELPLPGEHNVRNACAAAAVCLSLGLSLEQLRAGLNTVAPVSARLLKVAGINGATLFDDSYNANPASVQAAASFLARCDGKSIMVLADMGELGGDSATLHYAAGAAAKAAGVDRLFATGELSRNTVEGFGPGADWLSSSDAVIEQLRPLLSADTNVLIKGSRATHMGRVVRALRANDAVREEV